MSIPEMEKKQAEIEFMAQTGLAYNLEDFVPRKQAILIRQLGCPEFECRELHTQTLADMGQGVFEALVWGTRMKDAEIVTRCRILLRKLYVCPLCKGSGQIEVRGVVEYDEGALIEADEDEMADVTYTKMCSACDGTGDGRKEK